MPEDRTSDEDEPMPFVDRWLLPYVEDSALWPVLIVLLAHVAAFVTPVTLFAIRDRSIFAMVVSVAMLYGSGRAVLWEHRRRGHPSTLSLLLLIIWVSSGVAAYYTNLHGFL